MPVASMSRRTSSKRVEQRPCGRRAGRRSTPLASLQVRVARAARRERPVRDAEEARLGAAAHAAQADERRHVAASLAAQLRHDRAERRVVGGAVDALAVAGHDERVGVLVDRDDRADDGELVPHLGLQREVLADLHAGDVGRDRLELAAELRRGVGLEVVHVHVRRAAGQVDHDGRLVATVHGCLPWLRPAALAASMSASVRPAPKAPIWRKLRR